MSVTIEEKNFICECCGEEFSREEIIIESEIDYQEFWGETVERELLFAFTPCCHEEILEDL